MKAIFEQRLEGNKGANQAELGEEHSRQREQPNAQASRQGWTGMHEEKQANFGGSTRRRDGPD